MKSMKKKWISFEENPLELPIDQIVFQKLKKNYCKISSKTLASLNPPVNNCSSNNPENL